MPQKDKPFTMRINLLPVGIANSSPRNTSLLTTLYDLINDHKLLWAIIEQKNLFQVLLDCYVNSHNILDVILNYVTKTGFFFNTDCNKHTMRLKYQHSY